MFDPREELEYEYNARYDYLAELAYEHRECEATLDAEAEDYARLAALDALDAMEARGGPDYQFLDIDDEIPW